MRKFDKRCHKYIVSPYFGTNILLTVLKYILFADLQKQFLTVPHPDRIEANHQVEMQCLPPPGVPTPTVRWLKNGALVEPDANVIISSEGHLLIGQARLRDSANYSCVAENLAAKRVTRPVQLLVYG